MAMIGVGVGLVVGGMLLAGGVFYLYQRRKKSRQAQQLAAGGAGMPAAGAMHNEQPVFWNVSHGLSGGLLGGWVCA